MIAETTHHFFECSIKSKGVKPNSLTIMFKSLELALNITLVKLYLLH